MTSPIVVFDGECSLCNGFVAWLVTHDRHGRFRIAGSNGEVGRAVIAAAGLPADIGDSTIVLWEGGRVRMRSDAVLRIAVGLPWPWKIAVVARMVPRPLRNRIYQAVAKRRKHLNAEDPSCGVPPPELAHHWRSRLATVSDV